MENKILSLLEKGGDFFVKEMGFKEVIPTNKGIEERKGKCWVSIRHDKKGKKHIVINLLKTAFTEIGWNFEKDRVNIRSAEGFCVLEPSINGNYALSKDGSSRSETKLSWRKEICDEPMKKGIFPVEIVILKNTNKIAFEFPKEIFEKNIDDVFSDYKLTNEEVKKVVGK